MYRRRERPYTRREYMGGVPGSKVVHYDMGNLTEDFPIKLTLVVKEPCQIRHTALEAARVAANRFLLKAVGRTNYHLKLRTIPTMSFARTSRPPAQEQTAYPAA